MDWNVYSCHDDIHLSNRADELIPFLDKQSPAEEDHVSAAAGDFPLGDVDLGQWIRLGLPGVSSPVMPMRVPGQEGLFPDDVDGCSWLQCGEEAATDDYLSFGVDELMSFLYQTSPEPEDRNPTGASAGAVVTNSAFPMRKEWATWIQLGLPGDSLSRHEEHPEDAFLSEAAVWPGHELDGGSPPYYDSPKAALGTRNLFLSSLGHPFFVDRSDTETVEPVIHMELLGKHPFSDVDIAGAQCEELARTDSEPEPNDITRLQESSPERSSESSPSSSGGGGIGNDADVKSLPATLQEALEDVTQPVSEASPPDGVLSVPLLKHQRIALWWMIQKETCAGACAGGILADDQGLGKTLSTIALIVSERPQRSTILKGYKEEAVDFEGFDKVDDLGSNPTCRKRSRTSPTANTSMLVPSARSVNRPAGGTLVVCPTSVLRQWADELRNKLTAKANLSFLVYYGPNRTGDPEELAVYDVVLTTYHVVSMEFPKEVLDNGDDVINDDEDWLDGYDSIPRRRDADDSAPISSSKKRRKNRRGSTKSGSEDAAAAAARRALPLAMVAWFRVVLDEAQTIKNHKTLAARACSRLVAKRRWCLSGTPIQNSINDLYSYFRFLRHETYSVSSSFRYDIRLPIERKLGSPADGYRKLQEVLKGVLLRRTKETLIDGQPIVNLPPKSLDMKALDFSEEERAIYNNLESASREQFKEYQFNGTVKQNFVNILQLLLRLRQACNHPRLIRAGFESSSSPPPTVQIPVENAMQLGKDKCLDLLECMAASQALCVMCSDPPEDAVVSVCGHVFCYQCVSECLSRDDAEEKMCAKPGCRRRLSVETVFTRASLESCIGEVQQAPETSFPGAYSTENGLEQKPVVFDADSSKIKAAMEMLLSLPTLDHPSSSGYERPAPASQTTEKALVFSQWTKMLDLLENKLRTSSIQYRRLDGTMPIADRDRAVKEFNTQPEVTVMLMSLKAASVGLNMVAANHVLLLDPWWNPTTEDQAIDRAHRIGQKRPVNVTRFTVKDTVEDRIMKLQEKKRRLVASAFGEVGKGSRQSKLTVDDLSYLFRA